MSNHPLDPVRVGHWILYFPPALTMSKLTIPGISDHDAILFEVDLSPKYIPKPARKMYQFHKADYDGLRSQMSFFSNQYLASDLGENSVKANWHKITKTIHEAMDKYTLHRLSKAKRHLPWVSPPVKRLMNKRDRAHKKTRRTGKPKLRSHCV